MTLHLKMERIFFHPLRCSKFEKSAISMIGIFDRLTKLLNNIKRLDIPVNCINKFDGCCGMDGMNQMLVEMIVKNIHKPRYEKDKCNHYRNSPRNLACKEKNLLHTQFIKNIVISNFIMSFAVNLNFKSLQYVRKDYVKYI